MGAMISDSLQLQRAAVAYVYTATPGLDQADNLAFYQAVTSNRLTFPEFNQQQGELALLNRQPGNPSQVVSEIKVGMIGPNVFRFLYGENGGARPMGLVEKDADIALEAFLKVWGMKVGPIQMVEVTHIVRAAVNDSRGAFPFLAGKVTSTAPAIANFLGREFEGMSLQLVSNPLVFFGEGNPTNVLGGASIQLNIQVTLEDPRLLQILITVKWPRFQMPATGLPEEIRHQVKGQLLEMNVEAKQSHAYMREAYKYLEERVVPFIRSFT